MGSSSNTGLQASAVDRGAVLRILEDHNHSRAQAVLGSRPDSAPEVLYYLASEGDAQTRIAVAGNPATPAKANALLADDADAEVRIELACKIARLMPGLSEDENKRFCEMTIETLELLARDQLPRVRAMLSEEIKHLSCIPKHVVDLLARDVEAEVAAPILEYSPLLSDADLAEIVASAQVSQVLCAVARRATLSADVSDAIVSSLDVSAVASLLANPKASIRQKTLNSIVDHAKIVQRWHDPLVMRIDLSQRAIRRIATFVGASLLARLAKRHTLDETTQRKLSRELRRRVQAGEPHEDVGDPAELAMRDAEAAMKEDRLGDAYLEAAIDANRRESVIAGLALLGRVPPDVARRMLNAHSAKIITALAWHAGLSMRVAFKIQSTLLRLPTKDLLPAREGIYYPLSDEEMRWHLDYFGVVA